jgi:hypothetical protein
LSFVAVAATCAWSAATTGTSTLRKSTSLGFTKRSGLFLLLGNLLFALIDCLSNCILATTGGKVIEFGPEQKLSFLGCTMMSKVTSTLGARAATHIFSYTMPPCPLVVSPFLPS